MLCGKICTSLCVCEWEPCQDVGGSSLSRTLRTSFSSYSSVPCEAPGASTARVALTIFVTPAVSKENNYWQIITVSFCGFSEVLQTVRKDLFFSFGWNWPHIIFVIWELFHFSAFIWSIRDEWVALDGFLSLFCTGADPPSSHYTCLSAVFSFHIYVKINSSS